MRAWIHKTNLDAYKHLCAEEGYEPHILEETDDDVRVDMTAQTASVWNMVGYWYQLA